MIMLQAQYFSHRLLATFVALLTLSPETKDVSFTHLAMNATKYFQGIKKILTDDGTLETIKATCPAGTGGRRFVHLNVSRLYPTIVLHILK